MARLFQWIDDRTGLGALLAWFAGVRVRGGPSPRYVFGSVLLYLFVLQCVVGVLLATYYSPSVSDAWASTAYIQDRVTGGWFIRGLHHHGMSSMVVVTLLHTAQVLLAGAYRKPRELNWMSGLAMGGLVLAFSLTGYLLPWDQNGYFAGQVRSGIAESVPGGGLQIALLQGGARFGNLTLTRTYALHTFVLPGLMFVLMLAHVALYKRHGNTPPARMSDAQANAAARPHFPHQLVWDLGAMALAALALVLMTHHTHGAPLHAPAQPTSQFSARPEWFFLFLFELLHYFDGPAQIVGTVFIPGAVATFLVLLPWIDRGKDRRVRSRLPALGGASFLFAGVTALSLNALAKDAANEDYQKAKAAQEKDAAEARRWALEGVLPEGGAAVYRNDPKYVVRALFAEHCATCHQIEGKGAEEAPTFEGYNSRPWIAGVIRDPNAVEYFGATKHRDMDPYPEEDLPKADLDALVEHIVRLSGADHDAELAKRGAGVFEDQGCDSCHEVEPGEASDGPNLGGRGSAAWIARVISDSSAPDLFGSAAEMPKFADKLSKAETQELADYILEVQAASPPGAD